MWILSLPFLHIFHEATGVVTMPISLNLQRECWVILTHTWFYFDHILRKFLTALFPRSFYHTKVLWPTTITRRKPQWNPRQKIQCLFLLLCFRGTYSKLSILQPARGPNCCEPCLSFIQKGLLEPTNEAEFHRDSERLPCWPSPVGLLPFLIEVPPTWLSASTGSNNLTSSWEDIMPANTVLDTFCHVPLAMGIKTSGRCL